MTNKNNLTFDSNIKKSFWNQLETDIQQIGHRARTNLQKYQQIKLKETSKPQISKQMPQKKLFMKNIISSSKKIKSLNQSFNSIDLSAARRIENQQKQKQKILRNRINFIKVENNKQFKTIELARKKYQKIMTVRNSSLKEKQLIKKKRQSMIIDQLSQNQQKVKKIKNQNQVRLLSISRLKQQNKFMGEKERQLKKRNQFQINQQKSLDLNQKKNKVKQTKSSLSISRQKLNQFNESHIQDGKRYHKVKIMQKFRSIEKRNKTNNLLSQHLQRQINTMRQKRRRSTLQLQNFEKALGLNLIRKTQNYDLGKKNKKSGNFYITSL